MPKPTTSSMLTEVLLGLLILIAVTACGSIQPTPMPPPTHTPAPTPTPTPAFLPLAGGYRPTRGVNLGNALEAPQEGE